MTVYTHLLTGGSGTSFYKKIATAITRLLWVSVGLIVLWLVSTLFWQPAADLLSWVLVP